MNLPHKVMMNYKKNNITDNQLGNKSSSRKCQWNLIPGLISTFLLLLPSCQSEEKKSPYNVLMICVDDLRPELGCYGNEIIKSPNIDRLANEGAVFENHFVQSAVCGPSRTMMLTGKITTSWDGWRNYRRSGEEPDFPISLPHLFRKNGYHTVGIGKISHKPGGVMDDEQSIAQIPYSWDTTYTKVGDWETPEKAFFAFAHGKYHNRFVFEESYPHIPYEAGDVDDTGYPDGLNAREAVGQLTKLSEENKPFFLAVGFYKPPLPFNAPKKYWDLYERNTIPPAENDYPPENLENPYSLHNSYEVTTHYYWPDGEGNINNERARDLKHGYYACVSYIDAQIGLLLDELEETGLSENTIVLLWGDHGWHLGEHGMFGKQTNYTIATRSPLILKVPGLTGKGDHVQGLVETIDIYPTLAELCELEAPEDLQGQSFKSLLIDPSSDGKTYARSFYKRDSVMGKTIMTERYRLVRWKTEGDQTVGLELYDHKKDPDENVNAAGNRREVRDSLAKVLEKAVYFNE